MEPSKLQQSEQEEETEIEVLSILKHRTVKGRLKFLLKFSDGTSDYATENEAKLDCPKLLREYKKNKMNVEKYVKRKKIVLARENNRYRCVMIHNEFESFIDEGNEQYFRKGQPLWNVKCRSCDTIIGDEEGDNIFKPSLKCPAYVCRGRTKGCRETICFECAKKLILEANDKG